MSGAGEESGSPSDRLPALAALWRVTTGDPRIAIAVLDGPVDLRHRCFDGAQIDVAGAPGAGRPTGPAAAHGTHIASVLFAQPGTGLQGIAPRCRGLVVPVFADAPDGGVMPCSPLDLARAIVTAVDWGAAVINISGGVQSWCSGPPDVLARAVDYCERNDVLVVAAAGNDARECLHVPAALTSVLAVGAVDADGRPLPSSNWDRTSRATGIVAPGSQVPGAQPGGGFVRRSGTSVATAIVSGVAALLLSAHAKGGRHRQPVAAAVRDAIARSAIPCRAPGVTPQCLGGRLDPLGALDRLSGTGVAAMTEDVTIQEHVDAPALAHDDDRRAEGVRPSECGCAGRAAAADPSEAHLVYALGQIAYDFGSQTRADSFIQHGVANPHDPEQLAAHLTQHPEAASAVTWTLMQDAVPIYALRPAGAFAAYTYMRIRELLQSQLKEGVERVSIPGVIAGRAMLASGQIVPAVVPELRGMYGWSTQKLAERVAGADHEKARQIGNFLGRIYYEVRNLGFTPPERAMNFAATNAFQAEVIFRSELEAARKLDTIGVERSPICRPDADCWDVKLTFFDPARRLEQARHVHRFTVDVSDVVPVTVGPVRHWDVF